MLKSTVLIVDDEDVIRETMKEMLDSKGYNVLEASNGVAGLKICAETPVDLIVLDLNMPRMDGYMFMEHLQTRWEQDNRRWSFPKILILTAVDKKTDIGLSQNLGANLFMNKPFKSSDFLEGVHNLLKK